MICTEEPFCVADDAFIERYCVTSATGSLIDIRKIGSAGQQCRIVGPQDTLAVLKSALE